MASKSVIPWGNKGYILFILLVAPIELLFLHDVTQCIINAIPVPVIIINIDHE